MPDQLPSTSALLDSSLKTKPEVLSFLDSIVSEGESRLWPLRRVAYECVLWTIGEQNLSYSPSTRRWIGRRAELDYLIYPQINLVLPACEIAYAQLMRTEPESTVVPNTPDEEDRQGARASDRIRRFKNNEDRIPRKVRRAAFSTVVTGDHFGLTYLGADYKRGVEVPIMQPAYMTQSGQPIAVGDIDTVQDPGAFAMGPDGQPIVSWVPVMDPATGQPKTRKQPTTDCFTEFLSKFEVILDLDATSFDDVKWFLYKKLKSLEWIGDTFGTAARDEVVRTGKDLGTSSYQYKLFDVITRSLEGGYGAPTGSIWDLKNSTVVRSYIQAPSAKYPKGRVLIATGQTLLYSGDNPWALTEDPQQLGLVQFGYHPIPDAPWHFGLPKNIIDLNRRLRGLHASMIHHRRTMGFGQWIVPKGSGMMTDRMSGKPGLILTYDSRKTAGAVPQRVSGVQMDPGVIQEEENIRGLIKDISGTNEVLEGKQPYAGMPGIALNLLAEKASARFTYTRQTFEEALEQMDSQRLQIIVLSRRWTKKQMVSVLGRDGEVSADYLMASDMRSNIDVRYEIGTKRAASHAAYQQQIIDMISLGLIDAQIPGNRLLAREEMGMAHFLDQDSLDAKKARWENSRIEAGQPAMILPFENSEIHLREHIAATKTVDFLYWPEPAKQLMWQHVMETAQKVQATEQMAAMTAAGDGTGAEMEQEAGAGNGVAAGSPQAPKRKQGGQQGSSRQRNNGRAGMGEGGSYVPGQPDMAAA